MCHSNNVETALNLSLFKVWIFREECKIVSELQKKRLSEK